MLFLQAMRYIDAHTHAHFAAFKDDWREVISRALEAGVAVVNVGTQKDTSRRAVEVAHEFESGVYACVGLHPIHSGKSFYDVEELGDLPDGKGFTTRGEDFDYNYYKKLALDPRVVAIGECGLDYYRLLQSANSSAKGGSSLGGKSQIEKQKEAFIKQIELANDVKKPLMIHCREAFSDLIDVLNSKFSILNSRAAGIVHFFTGTSNDAKKLLDLGFYFTFGGVVTFPPKADQPPSGTYNEVIKMIPIDRILSETDAPYVTPEPYRGKRNEPLYVVEVVKKLAEIKGVSTEEMADKIMENVREVLGIRF